MKGCKGQTEQQEDAGLHTNIYDYSEYVKYVEDSQVADKLITYDEIDVLGEFSAFRQYDTSYLYTVTYLVNSHGEEVSFGVSHECIVDRDPNPFNLTVLSDFEIDSSNMTSNKVGLKGMYFYDGIRYTYNDDGKLVAISWLEDWIYFGITIHADESSNDELSNDPNEFISKFYNLETALEAKERLTIIK